MIPDTDAIAEANKELCILSVVDTTENIIVEHRLVSKEKSDEALLSACAEYVANWDEHTSDDHEAIQDNGYYGTDHYHICVIHLDEDGCYSQ